MERLRRHYLVPLLMVLILFLIGLALILNIVRRTRLLRAETVFLATPLHPVATAPQRLVTPAVTYPPLEFDLVQSAMRAADPEADLRSRTESLVLTLEAPIPTVPGGPTWTPSPIPSPTAQGVVETINCTVTESDTSLRIVPQGDGAARGQVSLGDELVATGRSNENLWAIVSSADGVIGWVTITALDCELPLANLTVVEP